MTSGKGLVIKSATLSTMFGAPTEETLSVLNAYSADLMEAFADSTAVTSPGLGVPEMVDPMSG